MKYRKFLSFCVVGTVGFCMDVVTLHLVSGFVGLFYGRVISFVVAVFSTWILNRKFTFRDHQSQLDKKQEISIYFLIMLIGGGANYILYALLILYYDFFAIYPTIAVAIGSLAGLILNYATANFFLFRSGSVR